MRASLSFCIVLLAGLLYADQDAEFAKLKQWVVAQREKSQQDERERAEEEALDRLAGSTPEAFVRSELFAYVLAEDVRVTQITLGSNYDLKKIKGTLKKSEVCEWFEAERSGLSNRSGLLRDYPSSRALFTTETGTAYSLLFESAELKTQDNLEKLYLKTIKEFEQKFHKSFLRKEGREPMFVGSATMKVSESIELTVWTDNIALAKKVIVDIKDVTKSTLINAGQQYHDESKLPSVGSFLGFTLRQNFSEVANGWRVAAVNQNGKTYTYSAPDGQELIKDAECTVIVDNDGYVKLIGCCAVYENKANAEKELSSLIAKLEARYERKFYRAKTETALGHVVDWKMKFFARSMKLFADNIEAELTVFIARNRGKYSLYVCLLRHENTSPFEM